MSRARGWFLTENHDITGARDALIKLTETGSVKYTVMAKEKAPTTGHEHAHIYIYFKSQRAFNTIKTIFTTADIEKAKGTMNQAYKYVTKDGDIIYEYGDRPQPSKTIDEAWKEAVDSFKRGEGDKESKLYARYQKFFDHLEAKSRPYSEYDGELKSKNMWIYGPPGTGKSMFVRKESKGDLYEKNINKWWDGYDGQPSVVIEDIDPSMCEKLAHHIKVWADRYPFYAEVKQSHQRLYPQDFKLFITSNFTIEECFPLEKDQEAIKRRFKVVKMERFPSDRINQGTYAEIEVDDVDADEVIDAIPPHVPTSCPDVIEVQSHSSNEVDISDSDIEEIIRDD